MFLELMGYLPTIGKGVGLSDDTCTAVRRVVFQKCMAVLIDPLKQARYDGVEVRCEDLCEPPGSCPDIAQTSASAVYVNTSRDFVA
jgi:hypothetical protein